MQDFNFVIFYVDDVDVSAKFYADLFGRTPVEASPTFAMFVLASGARLGLWRRRAVEPAASVLGGGGELIFSVADAEAVRRVHAEWLKSGVRIAQVPLEQDFGYSFVGLDPDGHRLRVYVPSAS